MEAIGGDGFPLVSERLVTLAEDVKIAALIKYGFSGISIFESESKSRFA